MHQSSAPAYWPLRSMALAENKVLCAACNGVQILERLDYFLAGYRAHGRLNHRAPGTSHRFYKRNQQRFPASWTKLIGLQFHGTDVNEVEHDAGEASLIGVRGVGIVASVDDRAAGQRPHGLGGAAVVAQRFELRVDVRVLGADQISVVEAARAGAVADQVVAL